MHETWLSASAQRAYAALSNERREDFEEVCDYITEALALMTGIGFVTDIELYGQSFLRYWDNAFPFVIYFRLQAMGERDPRPVIEVHLLLPAQPRPPTQARI